MSKMKFDFNIYAAFCPFFNRLHRLVCTRPVMNWVKSGWSLESVRTPCQDTSSSSSLERQPASLYVHTTKLRINIHVQSEIGFIQRSRIVKFLLQT